MTVTQDSPLVSIVLPTYNGWRYLQESIASCLAQTYGAFELILVDDGSPDPRVGEILDHQSDPRVRVFRLGKNVGLPEALNAGFREARGAVMTWTSDDNLFRPNAIEVMVRELQRGDADFVYARSAVIDETGQTIGAIVPRSPDQLLLDNCIGPCFLFTREVREHTGWYDAAMRLVEDYDYWVRVSKHFRMRAIPDDLYFYRQHGSTLTSVEGRRRVEEMINKVRRRHFSQGQILRAEGMRAFHRGDHRAARIILLRAALRGTVNSDSLRATAVTLLPRPIVSTIVALKKRLRGR